MKERVYKGQLRVLQDNKTIWAFVPRGIFLVYSIDSETGDTTCFTCTGEMKKIPTQFIFDCTRVLKDET